MSAVKVGMTQPQQPARRSSAQARASPFSYLAIGSPLAGALLHECDHAARRRLAALDRYREGSDHAPLRPDLGEVAAEVLDVADPRAERKAVHDELVGDRERLVDVAAGRGRVGGADVGPP